MKASNKLDIIMSIGLIILGAIVLTKHGKTPEGFVGLISMNVGMFVLGYRIGELD